MLGNDVHLTIDWIAIHKQLLSTQLPSGLALLAVALKGSVSVKADLRIGRLGFEEVHGLTGQTGNPIDFVTTHDEFNNSTITHHSSLDASRHGTCCESVSGSQCNDIQRLLLDRRASRRPRLLSISDKRLLSANMRWFERCCPGGVQWQ